MSMMRRLQLGTLCVLATVALWTATTRAVQLSRQLADSFQQKIDMVVKNGAANPVRPRKTPIAEGEVNSYLAFHLKEKIPKGLADPQVTILGNGALAGRAMLDLDEFKRGRQSGGVIDPFNYMSGKVPVTARGVLRTSDGTGRFQLQSAELSGVPLPKPIVQELVTFFTRTRENPKGFDLDAPFSLPAKIRDIASQTGEAVVIQ
jgi:hypothetical protein